MNRSKWLPLVFLLACGGRGPGVSAESEEDPNCAPGYHEDFGTCVPEACGVGTWGDLEVDAETVHVSAGATDGYGSSEAPFGSIQQALDAAGAAGGGLVAVSAGTYPEVLDIDASHDGVKLAGRCRELVVLDASVDADATAGIMIAASDGEVELQGLTVERALNQGITVRSGTARVRSCAVADCENVGLGAYGTTLNDSLTEIDDCLLTGNRVSGVFVQEPTTSVSMRNTIIRDTRPGPGLTMSYSLVVLNGAVVDAEGCRLEGSQGVEVLVFQQGATAVLRDSVVTGAQLDETGALGDGLHVSDDGILDLHSCRIEGNVGGGITVYQGGVLMVDSSLIQDNGSTGIRCWDSGHLTVESSHVLRSKVSGLSVYDHDTLWSCETPRSRTHTLWTTAPTAPASGWPTALGSTRSAAVWWETARRAWSSKVRTPLPR